MMNSVAQKKTPEQMVEAIFALDLDPIKFKLMDKKEGQGWSREQADRNELEYRRFLALMAKYPDALIVPNTDVDKFWHGHILDTMKYAQDCENIFGYFLHHFPYFGMRDEEDAVNLANAANDTQRLYEKEFGPAEAATASYCVKADEPLTAAYCVKAENKARDASQDAAYCVKAAASYCVRASGKAMAEPDAAYCVRAAASYCVRASTPLAAEAKQDSAYCVRAAASYCVRPASQDKDIVTGKGRPTLNPVDA